MVTFAPAISPFNTSVWEWMPVVIAKSRIESRQVASVSMMPDGLLKTLTDREVLDLVAYLRTRQQVPLPQP